jgi:hypothetical protein
MLAPGFFARSVWAIRAVIMSMGMTAPFSSRKPTRSGFAVEAGGEVVLAGADGLLGIGEGMGCRGVGLVVGEGAVQGCQTAG